MRASRAGILGATMLAAALPAMAQFRITNTLPAHASVRSSPSTALTLYFTDAVDTGTVNAGTLFVRGEMRGLREGTLSSPASNVVVWQPAVAFVHGERIEVTIRSNVASQAATPLGTGTTVRFTLGTLGCTSFYLTAEGMSAFSDAQDVALGDLDGDGDLDMYLANDGSLRPADSVWLNTGSGTFYNSGQSIDTAQTWAVALGDVDGDADLDAFTANRGTPNRLWLNNGSGVFTNSSYPLGGGSSGVALGDLDRDGDLDAVLARGGAGGDEVWTNDGAGQFNLAQSLSGAGGESVDLGDVDRDGDLDILFANIFAFNEIWLNNGSGAFTNSGQNISAANARDAALGDLDGDGDLDIFISNGDFSGGNNGTNEVWFNNGSGIFSDSGQRLRVSDGDEVELGDFDGDGDLDAFVVNMENASILWKNNGNGVFTNSGLGFSSGRSGAAVGDLDADGDLDLVTVQFGGYGTRQVNRNISCGDLGVTKTDSADPAAAGGTVTYALLVTNTGPERATNVVLADTLPAGMAFLSATSAVGTITVTGQVVNWAFDGLAKGATVTATISASSGGAGTLTNRVTATTSTTDTNAANNADQEATTFLETADLGLALTDQPDPVVGDPALLYVVTVSNAGPGTAHGVVVTSALPAGVTPSGLMVTNLGDLAAGASTSFNIQVNVDHTTTGVLLHAAGASSSTGDPVPSNNFASASTVVTDTDVDGSPDFFDQDDDNDSMTDVQEAIAGTDGASSASVFVIGNFTLNSPLTVHFDSVTGRQYSLYVSTNLLADDWEQIGTNEIGNGTSLSITDTNEHADGTLLYRLGVRLAP